MANGNSKLTATIVSSFLSVFAAIIIGFFAYWNNQMEKKMDKMEVSISKLIDAVQAADVDDALQGRDIEELEKDLDEHIEEGER